MRLRLCLLIAFTFCALTLPTEARERTFAVTGWQIGQGWFVGELQITDDPGVEQGVKLIRSRRYEGGGTETVRGAGLYTGHWVRADLALQQGAVGRLEMGEKGDPVTVLVKFLPRIEQGYRRERSGEILVESFHRGSRVSLARGRILGEGDTRLADRDPAQAHRVYPDDSDFTPLDFSGTDEPELSENKADGHERWRGRPFIRGDGDPADVAMNDVRQGRLGDCYLLAAMAAVARTDPGVIRDLIDEHDDETYTVTLHGLGPFNSGAQVRVRQTFASNAGWGGGGPSLAFVQTGDERESASGTEYELWPMLIEKAWAKYRGSYTLTEDGFSGPCLSFLSGEPVEFYNPHHMQPAEIVALLKEAEAAGNPVCIMAEDTKTFPRIARELRGLNVVGYHAYAVAGMEGDKVLLYNPWGRSHPVRALDGEELQRLFANISIGRF